MKPKVAILTNASAADQRSMIGYGALLVEGARTSDLEVVEWRAASIFSRIPFRGRLRNFCLNIDRFLVTPVLLFGRKADLVHVVDPGNCVYLPLIRHQRSVVTVHDMIPWLAKEGRLKGFSPSRTGLWLMGKIVNQLAKVDQIIVVSEASQQDVLERVKVSTDRVQVIYNAVFQPMSRVPDDGIRALRSKLKLPQNAPIILHIGRNFYKNRETVLRVAAKVIGAIPEVQLVMVGELSPEQRALADELKLDGAVHVLSRVSSEDMAALYSTATVLLFPSLYEGFGLPVLEARMCGTPVICSNAGSLPEVAGPQTILLDPHAVEEMRQAVIDVVKGAALPSPEISPKFVHDRWVVAHLNLYNRLLKT